MAPARVLCERGQQHAGGLSRDSGARLPVPSRSGSLAPAKRSEHHVNLPSFAASRLDFHGWGDIVQDGHVG